MRLKELRKMRNMSQSQVAGAVGISLRAYQNYEYALREPNIETINKFADFFGVTTDYLFGRDTNSINPLDAALDLNGASVFDKKFIKAYLDIPVSQRETITKFIKKISNS